MTYFGGLTVSENASAPIFPALSQRPVGGAGGLSARFRRLMDKAGILAPLGAAKGQDGRVFRGLSCPFAEPLVCDATGRGERTDRDSQGVGRPQLGRDEPELHADFPSFDGGGHRPDPKLGEGGGLRMSKQKQQSPQKCPKCGNTENLTIAVTCVPDRESTWGGRVDWDNDSATTCGGCGFAQLNDR